MSNPLEPITSDRGVTRFPPVDSTTGGEVEVYESSIIGHVWMHLSGLADPDKPDSELIEVTAQLTLENAAVLRDQLAYLIDNVPTPVFEESDDDYNDV